MALKKQQKAPAKKKATVKRPTANSRIKEIGGTHWTLSKDMQVKKYKGFPTKQEAEQFAAATPVEKGVKITAEKSRPVSAKKKPSSHPSPAPRMKKPYTAPTVSVVGLDQLPPSGNDPKVKSFKDGQRKYRK